MGGCMSRHRTQREEGGGQDPLAGGCDALAADAQSGELLHRCSSSSKSHRAQVSLNLIPNHRL